MLRTCIILGSIGILLVSGLPAPQDDEYADEYADEEVCLTTKDSAASEKDCVFPFTFNNFTYNGCPTDPADETKTKRWCSTKVDETGNHIPGGDDWGYCTKGCPPEIFPDEFELGSEAGEASSDACDWTACNGFTLKINVFDKEVTYGQCQLPAGKDGSEDDFFCFVNADSNCADKTLYDKEKNLFVSSTACTDPRAPLPRFFNSNRHNGAFTRGFSGGSNWGSNRFGGNNNFGGNDFGGNDFGNNGGCCGGGSSFSSQSSQSESSWDGGNRQSSQSSQSESSWDGGSSFSQSESSENSWSDGNGGGGSSWSSSSSSGWSSGWQG